MFFAKSFGLALNWDTFYHLFVFFLLLLLFFLWFKVFYNNTSTIFVVCYKKTMYENAVVLLNFPIVISHSGPFTPGIH